MGRKRDGAGKPGEARPPGRSTRSDDADAFFPDPGDGPALAGDQLAEKLGEDFVRSATSGDDRSEHAVDETTAAEELTESVIEIRPRKPQGRARKT